MTAWLIRAGRGAKYADEWLAHGHVAIYWPLDGLDLACASRDDVRERVDLLYGEKTVQARATIIGQAYRFGAVMSVGDMVVVYDPSTRLYHIGSIESDCQQNSQDASNDAEARYLRDVSWQSTVPRDDLSDTSRNSLGTIATLSLINNDVYADLSRHCNGKVEAQSQPDTDAAEPSSGDDEMRVITEDEGIERIKDRILSLDWDDLELLVAGMLRAMGYRTMMTGRGGDRGRDIIASPDGLGLSAPRIVVEVKHRGASMDAPTLRSFIAGLHDADRGLYVSTGGFTKEAAYEAARARIPVTLLDLDRFTRILVDNYENTDTPPRALLPRNPGRAGPRSRPWTCGITRSVPAQPLKAIWRPAPATRRSRPSAPSAPWPTWKGGLVKRVRPPIW